MNADEARLILVDCEDDDEPVALPAAVLSKLTVDDMPDGAVIQVGTPKDGILHLDWNGTLGRDG